MSFSDRLKSFWDKDKDEDPKDLNSAKKPARSKPQPGIPGPIPPPPARSASSKQEFDQLLDKEKKENEAALKAQEKEAMKRVWSWKSWRWRPRTGAKPPSRTLS